MSDAALEELREEAFRTGIPSDTILLIRSLRNEIQQARAEAYAEALEAFRTEFAHRKEWFNAICDDLQESACDGVLVVIDGMQNPYEVKE